MLFGLLQFGISARTTIIIWWSHVILFNIPQKDYSQCLKILEIKQPEASSEWNTITVG